MKKVIAILLAVMLLSMGAVSAMAADGCLIDGPVTVRASDTINIAFCAGGGATHGSGSVVFDGSQMTPVGYTSMLGDNWAVEFTGNDFRFYQTAETEPLNERVPIFYVVFDVSPGIVPGATISASVSNVTINDAYMGSYTWTTRIAEPLNSNADLATLTVSNATISPAFDPSITEYKASVPLETEYLQVTATAAHPGAEVTVGRAYLPENETTDVTVTVTAERGNQKVYHILTTRGDVPTDEESTVNTLDSLEVEGFPVSPAFAPEKLDYAVYVPYETTSLEVSAQLTDSRAELTVPELAGIPVGRTTYEIVVTAENGDIRTYTLTVFRAEEFLGPDAIPKETEPEETEPTIEPTTEPTTKPTMAPAEPEQPQGMSKTTMGLLWVLSLVAAFIGGIVTPVLMGRDD